MSLETCPTCNRKMPSQTTGTLKSTRTRLATTGQIGMGTGSTGGIERPYGSEVVQNKHASRSVSFLNNNSVASEENTYDIETTPASRRVSFLTDNSVASEVPQNDTGSIHGDSLTANIADTDVAVPAERIENNAPESTT